EIIVIDDHSEDGTKEIIDSFIAQSSNFTSMSADVIPEGWGGKSYANHLAATGAKGEYFIFMDADVYAKPDMLGQVISHVVHHDLDVASIVPRRTLYSWPEKILLAPIFLNIAVAFEERKVKLSGEFILFRKEVYQSIGGHTAVKSTVSDDLDFGILLE